MSDRVQDAADSAGLRVSVVAEEDARPRDTDRVLDAVGFANVKWAHAKARIFRILEGAGKSHATSIAEGVKDAEMPKLAREYVDLVANYKFFRYRASRWNPFYGLSDVDAARKFVAMVFDICDRSSVRLGHWYTR